MSCRNARKCKNLEISKETQQKKNLSCAAAQEKQSKSARGAQKVPTHTQTLIAEAAHTRIGEVAYKLIADVAHTLRADVAHTHPRSCTHTLLSINSIAFGGQQPQLLPQPASSPIPTAVTFLDAARSLPRFVAAAAAAAAAFCCKNSLLQRRIRKL